MLINRRRFNVALKLSFTGALSKAGELGPTGPTIVISATRLRRAIREHLRKLDGMKHVADPDAWLDDLFGWIKIDGSGMPARMLLSAACSAGCDSRAGAAEPVVPVELHMVIELRNGGFRPAVNAQRLLRRAVRDSLTTCLQSMCSGRADVCSFQMRRDFKLAAHTLDPAENVLREASEQLIVKIADDSQAAYAVEWRDLERIVAVCYEEVGFHVELQGGSQDGGKDIVLRLRSTDIVGSCPVRYFVQIKHWKQSAKVSARSVRRLAEASLAQGAAGCVFLSTSGFTSGLIGHVVRGCALQLGDLSLIQTLCRYYILSRRGALFLDGSLEDLLDCSQFSFPARLTADRQPEANL